MIINRGEVINKHSLHAWWPETQTINNPTRRINTMSDEKNVFDIEFEKAPEQGKSCHMQVDPDLHSFLKHEHTKQGVTFRKLANKLLCLGIQQYIKAKKLNINIKDRSKY